MRIRKDCPMHVKESINMLVIRGRKLKDGFGGNSTS
jgi:hypothetical protein